MSTSELNTLIILHGYFNPDFLSKLQEKKEKIFILENRPRLQSSQSAIDALLKLGIKPTLIADNMAGFLFFRDLVKEVHLTYQDKKPESVSTLIGGLILAVMAHKHQVPVYAYPATTILNMMDDDKSILSFKDKKVAYQKVQGYVPLVESVPNKYFTKIYN